MPKLFVEPESSASRAAAAYRAAGDLVRAAALDRIANEAQGLWIGEWIDDPEQAVDRAITEAGRQLRVLVPYAILRRDCESYSAGGFRDAALYRVFIQKIASGIRKRPAWIVLEPDALAVIHCLNPEELAERLGLLREAVTLLTASGGRVYLDGGSFNWISAADIAPLLFRAGIGEARGFFLNCSDSETTANSVGFARQLQAAVKRETGKNPRFIIDISRNGAGPPPDGAYCNPPSLRLGERPTLTPGIVGCDGLIRVKRPAESDGECNGGPPAGTWDINLALGLCGL